MLVIAPAGLAAKPGNSPNAKACQKGGWENLARSTDNSIAFSSEMECVSYAAEGGTLVAYSPRPNPQQICENAGGTFTTFDSAWRCESFSLGQHVQIAVVPLEARRGLPSRRRGTEFRPESRQFLHCLYLQFLVHFLATDL